MHSSCLRSLARTEFYLFTKRKLRMHQLRLSQISLLTVVCALALMTSGCIADSNALPDIPEGAGGEAGAGGEISGAGGGAGEGGAAGKAVRLEKEAVRPVKACGWRRRCGR